jgi:hypothetical protein
MLGGMGALTAGALGSGLGSYIETGDLGQGIQTGLMSFLGGKALGSLMGGPTGAEAAQAGLDSAATQASQAALNPADLQQSFGGAANMSDLAATQSANQLASQAGAAQQAAIKGPSFFDGLKADPTKGMSFMDALPYTGSSALISGAMMPPPDLNIEKKTYNTAEAEAANRDRFTPGAGFRGGIDPEFNYFGPIQYAEGGPTSLPISPRQMANKKLEEYMDFNRFMIRDDEASQRKDEFEETLLGKIFGGGRGLDYEGRQRANRVSMEQLKEEYPELYERVSKMNEGGIAALRYAEGGDMDMSEAPNDKELISEAVDAIKGKDDNPEIALARFVSRYGEDALRDLVERVQSGQFDANAETTEGKVSGVGDGMDDMIPATLEGEQDVVLSDGEFIVPADVVSGLGNGSTDAGSKSLYEMMDRVREMRTGGTTQPKQVPQGKMLPA